MSDLIEVSGLAVGWNERVLLEGLEFRVEEGEIFVILGGSGCGKSTLLRHLIGLERPLRGTIRVRGIGDPTQARGMPRSGVMFQAGALFGSLTLAENVALPLETWTRLDAAAIRAIAASKLALVGLAGFEDHLPAAISGGMKKRAAIARALALEPPLLFLDEPSAGLDPVTAVELDELLLALSGGLGATLVVVTHELSSIFKIASRCIMLDATSRSIIARGTPAELRESPDPRVAGFFNRLPRRP
jgi:phospholipid/cholesterol/gamma-HCH transport system ATP-binding protein